MPQLVYTIWALILHLFGFHVFRTCFIDAMEDEYGYNILSGPPITSFIFSFGVYVITSNLKLYPSGFRKLPSYLLGLYEFLATSFILEFALACVWSPIDIHIYTTLTNIIDLLFLNVGCAGQFQYNLPLSIICFATAIGFLLLALHATKSVDLTIYLDCGMADFYEHARKKFVKKLAKEMPKMIMDQKKCRRKKRRKSSDSIECL